MYNSVTNPPREPGRDDITGHHIFMFSREIICMCVYGGGVDAVVVMAVARGYVSATAFIGAVDPQLTVGWCKTKIVSQVNRCEVGRTITT